MKEQIINELQAVGINPVGCYEKLPEIIKDGIDEVCMGRAEIWEKYTTLGPKTKAIVYKLA